MKKHRIAIVGCGGMGGGHAIAIASGTGYAAWNEMPEPPGIDHSKDTDIGDSMELAGVYDIDPCRMGWAEQHGFKLYGDYNEILRDPEVDIVLVATPNHLHYDMSIKAMKSGKHVLCEKPVMVSSAELEEVMNVANMTDKIFYPRMNRRWDEDYRQIKNIYDNKLLGDVWRIESRVQGSRGIPGDWRGKKEYGGGMMLDWGVHLIDRMLQLVPEKVKQVFCTTTHILNSEVDDGFTLNMIFESGLTAVVEVGTCNFINLPMWYIAGNKGTGVIEDWFHNGKMVSLKTWDDKDALPIVAGAGLTKTMAPRRQNSIEEREIPKVIFDNNELNRNLVDTIDGKAEQIVKPEQSLRVLRLMETALKSAEKHESFDFE